MAKRKKKSVDEKNGVPIPKKRVKKKGQGAPTFRNTLPEDQQYVSVKMTLNQVLKREYSASFRQIIFDRCMAATRFQCLASLLLLYQVNTAVDNTDDRFFERDGTEVIKNCFMGVNADNLNDPTYEVPYAFKLMVNENFIQWPKRTAMSNSFKYMTELYTQNVKTNLRHWSYKRIKTFFNMKKFILNLQNNNNNIDDTDVKNALRSVFLRLDGTAGDPDRVLKMNQLLDELEEVGGDAALNMRTFLDVNWFKSLKMWIQIQRQIEAFHVNHPRTEDPTTPKIRNFSAIPLCNFQLKHIKIDHTELTEICTRKSQMGTFKNVDDNNNDNQNANNNRDDCWGSVFDMDKIRRIEGKEDNVNRKKFHYQFVSDSVSISLIYTKKKSNSVDNVQKISDDYNTNQIIYELGIDPGMKTWNATVRRTVSTNKEVIIYIYK